MTYENGGNNPDFESVTTDDLDIGGADLLTTGDFLSVRTYQSYRRSFSTTSTSYTQDVSFFRAIVVWDALPAATDGIQTIVRVDGRAEPTDVRLQNTTDGETVFEKTNITDLSARTDESAYIPTTTASELLLVVQIRADDGDSSASIFGPTVCPGVIL